MKSDSMRNDIWKWLSLLIIAVFSIYVTFPVKDKLRFGLDFKGGTSFTMGVDKDKLRESIIAENPSMQRNICDPQPVLNKIQKILHCLSPQNEIDPHRQHQQNHQHGFGSFRLLRHKIGEQIPQHQATYRGNQGVKHRAEHYRPVFSDLDDIIQCKITLRVGKGAVGDHQKRNNDEYRRPYIVWNRN